MLQNSLRAVALAALSLAAVANPLDSSFKLQTNTLQPYTPAYLGNGSISLVTSPLATSATRSFVAGLYDETPGDVPRISCAAAWNEVDIYNGTHWLNAAPPSAIEQYRQELDMYDGVLRTAYRWTDSGRSIQLWITQFVSRDNPHLAAVEVAITPEFSGRIAVRLPLRNWPDPHRYLLARIRKLDPAAQHDPWLIWYPGTVQVSRIAATALTRSLSMLAAAPGATTRLGEAVALDWPSQAQAQTNTAADSAEFRLTINVNAHQTYTFRKFAAIIRSSNTSGVREQAMHEAAAAQRAGWANLLAASTREWHELWQSDILVDGDPTVQRIIHSMLFYLLGSIRQDLDISIGPMGLSSAGYYGHIFWDADTFMFPALVVLHPELARPIVAFRSKTRSAALENAHKNGFRGAMFPWEAGPDGHESTPLFAFQNASSENHVNGDVALAAWQYWLATGDRAWLQNDCWPILRDTADFWTSRVSFDRKRDQYVIGNVVAVNESQIGISNDPYTNAVAKKNLQIAMAAAALLHTTPNPQWKTVAEKMFVPQSDSALLWYPLDRPYSAQQTHAAILSELSRIQNHRSGAMMGTEFYSILAAQIEDRSDIMRLLIPLSVPYLRPPFQAIAETPQNQNISFITGAGAFLQQFLFGYTGLRLTEDGLEHRFQPVLPPGITRLTLHNANVHGHRQSLTFTSKPE